MTLLHIVLLAYTIIAVGAAALGLRLLWIIWNSRKASLVTHHPSLTVPDGT